ncbi:PREDICTED: zinc finger protein 385B-like [Miniopterus natalensis]|uniref:zinc finger protein 385B-like n=1 Tax=Miniopterus natalensis TaxID=291302 RepID=UPI0007A71320|nr:PREDICTED: zinc finger protein 385B-like [Miniopterus natalensis]
MGWDLGPLFRYPRMKYYLSPANYPEDGIMNMATFLRGFEDKRVKTDRPEDQFSKEKKKILFSFCEVCNIQLNSAAQAQVHYNGKSHRKRVKQLSDGQPQPPAQGAGTIKNTEGGLKGCGQVDEWGLTVCQVLCKGGYLI